MKRWTSIIIAIFLVSSLVLSGCGKKTEVAQSTQSSAETTKQAETAKQEPKVEGKIVFMNNRIDLEDKLKLISDEFKAKYPDAEVEIQAVQDWGQAVKIKLAANDAPDVMYTSAKVVPDSSKFPEFYAPLDDMGYSKDTIAFYGQTSFEGKVYGLAESVTVTGVLCSKKTLADAGIAYPPIKTLDELYAAADKLKSKGITPFGSMVKTNWPLSNWSVIAYANLSGSLDDYIKSFVTSDTPYTKDSPDWKMLEFLKTFRDKGYFEKDVASSDWDIIRKDMSKTGFLMLANFGLTALEGTNPEDIGFFPLPIDNSGKTYSAETAGNTITISKNTKYPVTAKAFVKYWLDESVYSDYIGSIPSVKARKSGIPQIAAFMDMKPVIIEVGAFGDLFNNIKSKAQFNINTLMQEVLMGADIQETSDKYNKIWADARKAVSK